MSDPQQHVKVMLRKVASVVRRPSYDSDNALSRSERVRIEISGEKLRDDVGKKVSFALGIRVPCNVSLVCPQQVLVRRGPIRIALDCFDCSQNQGVSGKVPSFTAARAGK